MFGIGMTELMVILVVALIFIGPKKLPEIAQALGKGFAEFRKATQDIKESINIDNEVSQVKSAFKDMQDDVKDTVKGATSMDAQWDDVLKSDGSRPPGSRQEKTEAPDAEQAASPQADHSPGKD